MPSQQTAVQEVSLHKPQVEFVQNFLQTSQLQRILIYFSKQKPTDPHTQYSFTDVIVRLINEPLCIVFGQHGVYFFSNYLLVYPYNEFDSMQTCYLTNFLRSHVHNLPLSDMTPVANAENQEENGEGIHSENNRGSNQGSNQEKKQEDKQVTVPSMKMDVRITKQMGGGYTVRPLQLSNIHLDTFSVLTALVRGVMCGSQKHCAKYRQHAVNLQLQRILTRIVISRAQLHEINTEIEVCMASVCQQEACDQNE